jgi:hypothetical protein
MSMGTCVKGFIPPDANFQRMSKAYAACEAAGIAIPKEIEDFFNGETPDPAGVKIDLSFEKKYSKAVKEYNDETYQGYEIDLETLKVLAPAIKIIRVLNSW